MSNTTYPVFNNMLPTSEDIQLIMDSLREQLRNRTTADSIFNPGICSGKQSYVSIGTNANTLKIFPFIGYNQNGDRIQNENTLDNLAPSGSGEIIIDESNIIKNTIDMPIWKHYTTNYVQLSEQSTSQYSILLAELKAGSILQGIKLFLKQSFQSIGDVYCSIGVTGDLEKYYPKTKVSLTASNTDIGTANISFAENQIQSTGIQITFYCDNTTTLSQLTSGVLITDLLISNLSNTAAASSADNKSGFELTTTAGNWLSSTNYYIVARYTQIESDKRNGIIINNSGTTVISEPFYARQTDSFKLYALRRSGTIIDPVFDTDIKLGEVYTDSSGNITSQSIFSNGYDSTNKRYYTDYLTLDVNKFPELLNEYTHKLFQEKNIIYNNTDNNVPILLSKNCDFYFYTPTMNLGSGAIFIDSSNLTIPTDNIVTFEFVINMTTLYTITNTTFATNISWLGNITPTFDTTGIYFIVFRSLDAGQTWIANFEGKKIIN